jgi:uncharacterized protein
MSVKAATRLSIFPLTGALLFPRMHLPLHIFEPRYCAMVAESLARDRRIGMIQPSGVAASGGKTSGQGAPLLFNMGCVGRIAEVEALEEGRYNLVLEGLSRFVMLRELAVDTPFRQVEAELIAEPEDAILEMVERAQLERESRRFADAQGYAVDWEAVSRLDDEALVNGIAQVAPFDGAAKQALLEAATLSERAELIIQLMQFFGRYDGESRVTLQ